MWRILQLGYPDDFVICTGKARTLREFVQVAFSYVGLDYQNHIEVKEEVIKRKSQVRLGTHEKLTRATSWVPRVSFESMIQEMVDFDLDLCKKQLNILEDE